MSDYRITKNWSDSDAEYYYTLEAKVKYDHDHSCYSCYDMWAFQRRKCKHNTKPWETVRHGDRAWAIRTAKHYKTGVPAA